MGWSTPILICHDTFHEAEQDPQAFVEALTRRMNDNLDHRFMRKELDVHGRQVAKVLPARHNDQPRLLMVAGGTIVDLMYPRLPTEIDERDLDKAQQLLDQARKSLEARRAEIAEKQERQRQEFMAKHSDLFAELEPEA